MWPALHWPAGCPRVDKEARDAVQGVDGAGFDVVDPAVELQPILVQGQGDRGMCPDVGQLGDDVPADHSLQSLLRRSVGAGGVNGLRGVSMGKPAGDGRQVDQARVVRDGSHRSAVRMATDDDVRDAQNGDRVFDCRGDAAGSRAVGRHDIAGVADHEQVAGFPLGQQFRDDPAVRAGNEHSSGVLGGGQILEESRALWKGFPLEFQKAQTVSRP